MPFPWRQRAESEVCVLSRDRVGGAGAQRIEPSPGQTSGLPHLTPLPKKIALLFGRVSRGGATAPKGHIAQRTSVPLPPSRTNRRARPQGQKTRSDEVHRPFFRCSCEGAFALKGCYLGF